MTLYNCKREISRDGVETYRITKFTADLDVEASYLTTREACDCPAGQRKTCRHRQMLPKFVESGYTNGQAFLNYDNGNWVPHGEPEFGNWAEPSVKPTTTFTRRV